MNSDDINAYCKSANFKRLANEIIKIHSVSDLTNDQVMPAYIASVLLHLDEIKNSIANINNRLTKLEGQ